ncbi:MAG: M20/M25/M40 family metallo-hydrolase, partial [Chloroflexi bacterium]|nr:M20/M25/M40 family metallo-hydrolase [Chloroflexota bacterium]
MPVYLRRVFILLVIGLIHGMLIWSGDILTLYALLGFILVLFRNRSARFVLVSSVLVLAFYLFLRAPLDAAAAVRGWYDELVAPLRWNTHPFSYYTTGTFWQITLRRTQDFFGANSNLLYFFGPVFSMMLLGLYAGKRQFFQNIEQHLGLVRRVMWVGLGIGIVFNGLYAATWIWNEHGWPVLIASSYRSFFSVGTRAVGAPALMLFYVTAIILLSRSKRWHASWAPLANVGRMALTNYLLQSVISTLIFYNYGLGLFQEVGPTFGLMLTLIIFSFQIQFSAWWLDRYQFGPVEWLWRMLSYGQRPPLRKRESYGNLRASRWAKRLNRVTHGQTLAAVWAFLIIWGLVLGNMYNNLGQTPAETALLLGQPAQEGGDTGSGSSGGTANAGEEQSEIIVTPAVEFLIYDPGPIAASGDLQALADTFNVEAAISQIETLTSAPYLGRYAGSPEGRAAGDYIASQFEQFGLQPAGDDGTFFQNFALDYISLASVPALVVIGPDGTEYDNYQFHQDYSTAIVGYLGGGSAEGEVVWANRCAHDDFDNLNVAGKIVMCRLGAAANVGRNAIEHGASGLLLLANTEARPLSFGATYRATWVPETIPALLISPLVAEDLLRGSGKTIAELTLHFESFPLASRVRMAVEAATSVGCPNQGCVGRNVLGVIPGRDPNYRDEVIIIGGHYDHLGQSPDGEIAWLGANDNASGIAVILELARTWQEQGYVPNRTVVFAAWDAEELGLVGSRYYVEHPRYPLDQTIYYLNLDMVGAGEDILYIDGSGALELAIAALADAFDIETQLTVSGRSDHFSFTSAGVPANMMIWFGAGDVDHYHRPGDTLQVIEPDKIEAVGRIAGMLLLGLTEGAPKIDAMLAVRARAVLDRDLAAFLRTSTPGQSRHDQLWFVDAVAYEPVSLNINAAQVNIVGDTASAQIEFILEYPNPDSDGISDEDNTRIVIGRMAARFMLTDVGWKWAGPDLVPVMIVAEDGEELPDEPEGFAFTVMLPRGVDGDVSGLGVESAAVYAQMADQLNMPNQPEAALWLYPNNFSLSAETALSLPVSVSSWVAPGVVKWIYADDLVLDQNMRDALAQLILAEAGVTESAASWLWSGLPQVLRAREDVVEVHAAALPSLRNALGREELVFNAATDYAAVDYLRQRLGWAGLGRFITDLGRLCQQGNCSDSAGANEALRRALGVDSEGFTALWLAAWQSRLQAAQSSLDAVLAVRAAAVVAGNRSAFLAGVDSRVPNLSAEQSYWIDDLLRTGIDAFLLSGTPAALYEDGSMLASVTKNFELTGAEGSTGSGVSVSTILFTLRGGSLVWAGADFEVIRGLRVSVYYPRGQDELAQAILVNAEALYPPIAESLGIAGLQRINIKLYTNEETYRASIALSYPQVDWVAGWDGQGGAIKLRLIPGVEPDAYHSTLATFITRNLLNRTGVESEWILKGLPAYLAGDVDNTILVQAVTNNLRRVARIVFKEENVSLADIPPDHAAADARAWGVSIAHAWDALRYIAITYGEDALMDFVRAHAGGQSVEIALRAATGQSLADFEQAWERSLIQSHADPEWVEIGAQFDVEAVQAHIAVLTASEMSGRQAGSPGARLAADYIAEKFAEYGLQPIVSLAPADIEPAGGEEQSNGDNDSGSAPGEASQEQETLSYFQSFPIEYASLLNTPIFEVLDAAGDSATSFVFRHDFTIALNQAAGSGFAQGELVWVLDSYDGLDLTGKIVVRRNDTPVDLEVQAAMEHGAAGLILIKDGDYLRERDLLAKNAMPVFFPEEPQIPVMILGKDGFILFQKATGLTVQDLLNSPPAMPLGITARMNISLGVPQIVETANVLGFLPGSDPDLSGELIIIGAHYDYVGDDPDTLFCSGEIIFDVAQFDDSVCERIEGMQFSGLNDNASGIAIMLEIARLWHAGGFQPKRSVLFI